MAGPQKLNYVGQMRVANGSPQNVELFIDERANLTDAERAAGIQSVNPRYEPGNVLRYGTNTTPGTTDMSTAIQDCLDTNKFCVLSNEEHYTGTTKIQLKGQGYVLRGEGQQSQITYAGTDAAIAGDGTARAYCEIRDLSIYCTAASKGIDFTWFFYGEFTNLRIEVRAANSACIWAKGNGLGTGPYYNNFSGLTLIGRNDNATYANQYGIHLEPATTGSLQGDGPNANVFSNLKRVAGFLDGVKIDSGNANVFNNVQFEAITNYAMSFNERTADFTGTATSGAANSFTDSAAAFAGLGGGGWKITAGANSGESGDVFSSTGTVITIPYSRQTLFDNTSVYEVYKTKALGNKFSNVRIESNSTARLARFYPGARSNSISNVYATSINDEIWVKDTEENTNSVLWRPYQSIHTVTFTASNLAAASTIELEPARSGSEGGIQIPFESELLSITVALKDFGAGGAGTGTVKVWKSGSEMTDAQVVVGVNNRLGTVKHLKKYDVIATNYRYREQDRVAVSITTNGSWDQTTADIAVTLVFSA